MSILLGFDPTLPCPVSEEDRYKFLTNYSDHLSAQTRPSLSGRDTLTGKWMEKYGAETRAMLVEHLSHKLPTSRRVKVVEDHVQTFLVRLVERDTLAPKILEAKGSRGNPINPSVLRVWCFQSACTEMRGWGVDASLRKSLGAKTNRDRMADQGKLPTVVVQSTEAVIERRYEVENGEVVSDIHNPNEVSIERSMISSETCARIRSLVQRKVGSSDPSLVGLVSLLMESGDHREAAAEMGISRTKMKSAMSLIREALEGEDLLAVD